MPPTGIFRRASNVRIEEFEPAFDGLERQATGFGVRPTKSAAQTKY